MDASTAANFDLVGLIFAKQRERIEKLEAQVGALEQWREDHTGGNVKVGSTR